MRARGAAAGSSRCYTITCGRDGGEPRHPRSPALPSREHRHPRSRAIALPRRAPASPDPGCSLAGGVGGWGARGNRLCRSASVSLPGGHRHPRLSPSRGASIPGYHPHRGAPHPRPPGYCPPGAPASPAITLTGGGGTALPLLGYCAPGAPASPATTPLGSTGYSLATGHRLRWPPAVSPPTLRRGGWGGGRRHRHPRSRAIPSWGRGGGHRHSRCPAVPPRGSHRFPPPPSRGPVPGSAVPGARVPGPVSAAAVVGPVRGGWRTSGGAAGAARGGLL